MSARPDHRIVVGMSGGVDSSVSALLLKREGYDVHGLFMTNWEEDEEGYCSNARDLQDAREVADRLGIPLHHVNFSREYRDRVFELFLAEHRKGRTPNPDVLCNREIKFGVFAEHAGRLGASLIATGHYARVDPAGPRLLTAADAAKDQTYFLHGVTADALARTRFPVGGLTKDEVRALARREGLPVHAKKDSTGICFIGERPFRDFLAGFLPAEPGEIVDEQGRPLGRHQGLMYYTIGQRQGLGLGGRRGAPDAPWYVAGKDLAGNRLVVVQGADHPALMSTGLATETPHWIGDAPRLPLAFRARIRHRQRPAPCRVERLGDRLAVHFDSPQRAVAPGQYAVFYDGEACLGGAVIERAEPLALPPVLRDAGAAAARAPGQGPAGL